MMTLFNGNFGFFPPPTSDKKLVLCSIDIWPIPALYSLLLLLLFEEIVFLWSLEDLLKVRFTRSTMGSVL